MGRSRGGLSTKIHSLVDGTGRPLVVLIGPGQAGDAPMFGHLMRHLRVARHGPGLTWPGQHHQGAPSAVDEGVDLRREPAAGTPDGVVSRLVGQIRVIVRIPLCHG